MKGQNHQNMYQFQSKKKRMLSIFLVPHLVCILPPVCVIWKAICAGVSFGSGADYALDDFECSCTLSHETQSHQISSSHANPYPVFPTSSTGSSNCKALCSSTAIFSNSGIHTRWLNPWGGDCLRSCRVCLLVRLPSPPS